MQTSSSDDVFEKIEYLVGTKEQMQDVLSANSLKPFDDMIVDFLDSVSKEIMKNKEAKAYSDLITFAFWIRKSSVLQMKQRFIEEDGPFRFGKGVAFHIAPSNVPVNFAYSLVTGLLTGNKNIVRVPSKEFAQVKILTNVFNNVLKDNNRLKPYITLVKYGRDKRVNDYFSLLADTRVIWGGDLTIEEIRKSPLPPRSNEITFADRYSIVVIDSDFYLDDDNKEVIANNFYNDTYFTDQNACSSPRIVFWLGNRIEEAKKIFWNELHNIVEKKYNFQDIQGVNKLTNNYLASANLDNLEVIKSEDNLITRAQLNKPSAKAMEFRENSGYFFEYDCKELLDVKEICDDKKCQTCAYIGDKEMLLP